MLKAISRSAFDLQPVLDPGRVAEALRCRHDAIFFLHDAERTFGRPYHGRDPEELDQAARSIGTRISGRGVHSSTRPSHVSDLHAAEDAEFTDGQEIGRDCGHAHNVGSTLLREGEADRLSCFAGRMPPSRQADRAAETFADQAVIAIENVRLFEEAQARRPTPMRLSSRPRPAMC